MKSIALVSVLFFLFSCTKENTNTTFKVRYAVSGDVVNEFKITQNGQDIYVTAPYSGSLDTVIYIESGAGSILKLEASGDCANLSGLIDIDGSLRATSADADIDGDGIAHVSVEYTIPKQVSK